MLIRKKRKISSVYSIIFTIDAMNYQTILAKTPKPINVNIDGNDVEISSNSLYNIPTKGCIIKFTWDEMPSCSGLFKDYSPLLTIDLSGLDTSTITDMSQMFSGCNKLKSIKFGDNFDTSNVQNMDYMFYNCFKLVSLDLKSFNTGKVVSMEAMLFNAQSLLSLNLFHFDTSQVTNMKQMFFSCNSLIYINLKNFNDTSAEIQNIFSRGV